MENWSVGVPECWERRLRFPWEGEDLVEVARDERPKLQERRNVRPHPACAAEAAPAAPKRQRGESARRRPGPLPRGEGERLAALVEQDATGDGAVFRRKRNHPTTATKAFELSSNVRNASLSLGERAGVRASCFNMISTQKPETHGIHGKATDCNENKPE
jgi:hypothetical protein